MWDPMSRWICIKLIFNKIKFFMFWTHTLEIIVWKQRMRKSQRDFMQLYWRASKVRGANCLKRLARKCDNWSCGQSMCDCCGWLNDFCWFYCSTKYFLLMHITPVVKMSHSRMKRRKENWQNSVVRDARTMSLWVWK